MTFDDARMYTKPFTIKFTEELEADSDILETKMKRTAHTASISRRLLYAGSCEPSAALRSPKTNFPIGGNPSPVQAGNC